MDPKDLTLQALYSNVKDHPDPTLVLLPTARLIMGLPFSWSDTATYIGELVGLGLAQSRDTQVPALSITQKGIELLQEKVISYSTTVR